MSIYGSGIYYGDGTFYGGDEFNIPGGGPVNLTAYQNVIGNAVLYWALSPCAPDIGNFTWEVQTDKVDTFDSPDLLTYTELSPEVEFIPGKIHKGMVVPIYTRLQGETLRMYWRVRGAIGGIWTVWSVAMYNIPAALDEIVRDSDLDNMPNAVYKKDAGSNVHGVHWTFGDAIDLHWVTDFFANADLSTEFVRDASSVGKMAPYMGAIRPQLMKMIDFREILRTFMAEARNSPTIHSVRAVIRSMVCRDPVFTRIEDTLDMYVSDDTPGSEVLPFYVSDDSSSPPVEAPTAWDHQHLAWGIIITVENPLGAIVSRAFMEEIVRKLVPAHVPVYVVGIP